MPHPNEIEWRRALRGEPSFDEVLADPIVHRLMARDGVSSEDLKRLRQARESTAQPAP